MKINSGKSHILFSGNANVCANVDDDTILCDALRDLVPFVQFKKREKHSWRSVTFSKAAD